MTQKILNLLLLVLFTSLSFSQTKEDVSKIIADYNLEKIKEKITFFENEEKREKEIAIKEARKNGWPIFIKGEDGTFQELMKLTSDGYPLYYSTTNANAAKSTRAIHLNTGGTLGLNLNGQDMVARVWDGGTTRRSHNSFDGRVTTVDDPSGTTFQTHGTHVTGTIVASNVVASTKGMAYQATARTFNWTNDESEAASETIGGMLISNHSYGIPLNNSSTGTALPAWYIGAYTSDSRNWDEISYLAPYYLPIMSAGNEGNNNTDNSNPISYGYDKLTGDKTAKNSLIVANAQDANVATDGALISVSINSSSSQGPTDDLRIKPDITGNGTSVLSTSSTGDSATTTLTGTSMASPNVAGTLILLQQHHKNLTNGFMKAATLKGLACHTADDAGNIGPDPIFGWGLLNAKKAAQTLSNNGLDSWVSEERLSQGQTFTMTVKSNGGSNNPLKASITWTDAPGQAKSNTVENDPISVLINNLDIKITKDGTEVFYPWRLNPSVPTSNALRNADNNVDNVEQVMIDTPLTGNYVITVTHKGTLVSGGQDFSLLITGVVSTFSLTPKTDNLVICSNQNAVYTYDYKQIGTGTTNFSAVNLPSGAIASFNPTSLSANGTVTMTISGISNVIPGEYLVGIQGNNGIEAEIRTKKLKVYSSSFQQVVAVSPTNNNDLVPTNYQLKWNTDPNAESYNVQISTSPTFASLVLNDNTTINQYTFWNLNQETRFYWRIISSNRCGVATNPTTFNFFTGKVSCGSSFNATNFSNATIATTADAIATVPIQVTGGLVVGDIDVVLNISHTYIQDFAVYLEGPAAIGSPIVRLFEQPCGDNDNIVCTVDDFGSSYNCQSTSPAISGVVIPVDNLSLLNGLNADGTWILRVIDFNNGDGGVINSVSLSICNLERSPLNTSDYLSSKVSIYPNPANDVITVNLSDNLQGETNFILYDIQGRAILEKNTLNSSTTINVNNLTEGIYLLSIKNGELQTTQKIIVKK